VVFVGLDIEDQKATAKAFVAANQVGYASLFDPNETLMMQFAQVVPSTSVPSTVIIDKQGRIAAKAIVTVTAEQLSAVLKPIIAEPS
jgi:peroxiredoxin